MATTRLPTPSEHADNVDRLCRVPGLLRKLVAYVNRYLDSWPDAEEVAQEACRLLLTIDDPETKTDLRSCLFRIAHNLAVDRLRRRGVRQRAERELAATEIERVADPVDIDSVALARAVERLRPWRRAVFILWAYDDLTVVQITERLQLSRHAVSEHLAAAFADLRRMLGVTGRGGHGT